MEYASGLWGAGNSHTEPKSVSKVYFLATFWAAGVPFRAGSGTGSPPCTDQFWDRATFLSIWYRELFSWGQSDRSVELTTQASM
jgi:hypothetical protein